MSVAEKVVVAEKMVVAEKILVVDKCLWCGAVVLSNCICACRGTGIPPWSMLINEVRQLKSVVQYIKDHLVDEFIDRTSILLDEKGVAAGNCPRDVMQDMLKAGFDDMYRKLRREFSGGGQRAARTTVARRVDDKGYTWYCWGGKFHRLPEDFVLSSRPSQERPGVFMTPQQAYLRWHQEDHRNGFKIPPLKSTNCSDYKTKTQKNLWSMWKLVCQKADEYLVSAGETLNPKPNADECSARWSRAINIHYEQIPFYHPSKRKRQQRRNGEIAKRVSTIAGEMKAMKKFKIKLFRHNHAFTKFANFVREFLRKKRLTRTT